jgi:hypothetical protein
MSFKISVLRMNSLDVALNSLGLRGVWIMLKLILAVCIGFGGGYAVREWISRQRRAVAREEYLRRQAQRQAQKRYDDSSGDVWLSTAPRMSDTDGTAIARSADGRANIESRL